MPPFPKTQDDIQSYLNAILYAANDKSERASKLVAPDIVCRFGNGPEIHGFEAALASFDMIYKHIADYTQKTESIGLVGDRIYGEWEVVSRLRVDPDFKFFTLRGCMVLHIQKDGPQEGLIKRLHSYFDMGEILDRMQQLGLA